MAGESVRDETVPLAGLGQERRRETHGPCDMAQQPRSAGNVPSALLPAVTAAFAALIFVVDTVTDLEIAVAVLYVAVVLMAARFCRARGVVYVALGCVGLTVLSFYLTPPAGPTTAGLVNMSVSILAIALTTVLALQSQSADAALQERANLLDLSHDAIFSRDTKNIIVYWNRGAEELYGWHRSEAIGKSSHELLETIFPVPLDQINAELERTDRWEGELVHKKRDGTRVIAASRWSLLRNKQGQPTLVLETNNDVTERVRAQQSLLQAQADLARANRVMLLGEMTASIAHEVNQPISGAITNANAALRWLAAQPPDLEEARHALTRIVRDGNRASDVISRVRTLVKKAPPRKESLDINETIREVMALTKSELHRNKINLVTHLSGGLPVVSADRVQVQQVVINLIVNAVDAMSSVRDRPRTLMVSSGRGDSNDVDVEVRDTGPGLNPEDHDRLFQSFYTTKADGMGMGLAISRSIIEAHGGRLSAEPNQPQGAVFRFTLPVEEQSPA